MARWTILKGLEYTKVLQEKNPDLYEVLDKKLGLTESIGEWEENVGRIYLTKPNEENVLPQDSTYLSLKDIDMPVKGTDDLLVHFSIVLPGDSDL